MVDLLSAAVRASLILVLVAAPIVAQELKPSERALVEAQVENHIEVYYDHYNERDVSPLPETVYTVPWIRLGADGIEITETMEEARAGFNESLSSLVESDWNRSTFETSSVCVLNRSAAIISGTSMRTREDGSVMSVAAFAYILGKTDDGWRIISFAEHSPDHPVRCDG